MEPSLSLCRYCWCAVYHEGDVCDRCDKLKVEMDFEEERDAEEDED